MSKSSTQEKAIFVSLLTPPGRGALAVVGVAGCDATAVVDRAFAARGGRPVAAQDDGAIAFGTWRATGEEVVVVRRRADLVEVHCHGGVAAAAAVVASLVGLGAEEVPWTRWLAASGEPEIVVEAHEALARVGGPKAARVGLRLSRPWRVVVAGPVNAGKSSLVNALAGHARSIVSREPGTTRDLVETRLVLDGWEVDLVDTAGLRDEGDAIDPVERAGIALAEAAAADADLVLRVWPADAGPPPSAAPDEILVVSKIDIGLPGHRWPADAVPASAATGAGIADLEAAIVARLVPEEHTEPDLLTGAVPFTPRQVDAARGCPSPRDGVGDRAQPGGRERRHLRASEGHGCP